jgi:hypothetical protein
MTSCLTRGTARRTARSAAIAADAAVGACSDALVTGSPRLSSFFAVKLQQALRDWVACSVAAVAAVAVAAVAVAAAAVAAAAVVAAAVAAVYQQHQRQARAQAR